MSFRNKTDLNPDIAVQNAQTTHLNISNASGNLIATL